MQTRTTYTPTLRKRVETDAQVRSQWERLIAEAEAGLDQALFAIRPYASGRAYRPGDVILDADRDAYRFMVGDATPAALARIADARLTLQTLRTLYRTRTLPPGIPPTLHPEVIAALPSLDDSAAWQALSLPNLPRVAVVSR